MCSDFQRPIDRKHRLEDYMEVARVERDKKSDDEAELGLNAGETHLSVLSALLLSYMKKTFCVFSEGGCLHTHTADEDILVVDLLEIRRLLQMLSYVDTSHELLFTVQLSELWHRLNQHFHHPKIEFKDWEVLVKIFIEQVNRYPAGSDHTFGYYLTKYAGKTWIPFPYMGLLRGLHEKPDQLKKWIFDLTKIVELLTA